MDKKNKSKKLKDVVIVLVLAIIIIGVSCYIANNSLKNSAQGQEQFKQISTLEHYFPKSKVEFVEQYKNGEIYKIYLDGKTYYVAYNKNGENIAKNYINTHLIKSNNSAQIMYANADETVIIIYENDNNSKGKYVLTLYTSISDLKEILDMVDMVN